MPRGCADAGTPLTRTVSGATAPVTFSGTGSGFAVACRQFEPRAVRRKQDVKPALGVRDATFARCEVLERRRQLRGRGHDDAMRARGGSGAGGAGRRANASNRIGAAALRPISRGTGAPSGRPTQTPMVYLPSKPTDQASR